MVLLSICLFLYGCFVADYTPEHTQDELEDIMKKALIEDSKQQIISKIGQENFQKFVRFDQTMLSESEHLFIVNYYMDFELAGIQAHSHDKGVQMIINYKEGQLDSMINVPDCVTYPGYCPPYKINTYLLAVEEFQKKCPAQNFTLQDYTEDSNTTTEVSFSFDEEKENFNWVFSEYGCGRRGCISPLWTVTLDPQTGDIYPVPLKWANGSIAAKSGEGFLC